MADNTLSLGEVARRSDHLMVECRPCRRSGLLLLYRLIGEHGSAVSVSILQDSLAAACCSEHKAKTGSCAITFPEFLTW